MDKLFKSFLTLALSVGLANAEVYQRPADQHGTPQEAEDVGCEVITSTGTREPSLGRVGALSLYWLMTSSFNVRETESTPAALTPSSFFMDIKNSSTTDRLSNFISTANVVDRVYMSSATHPVITRYDPPAVMSDGLNVLVNTNTIIVSACYLFKSSSTVNRRVATAENSRGKLLKNKDAGCIPYTVDYGSAPARILISTVATQASTNSVNGAEVKSTVFAAANPNGTLVYWVSATSAPSAASSNAYFQLGTATPTVSHLTMPGLVFDNPVGNTKYEWDPPWRSTTTVSITIAPTGGPKVTFCTRSIKETVER